MIDDWNLHDDPFDNFDENNDNDSDDDFEETKRKKKKSKGSGKKRSEINPDDKPFVCDKCGVKYKTKPGLTYHVQKMHNNLRLKYTDLQLQELCGFSFAIFQSFLILFYFK